MGIRGWLGNRHRRRSQTRQHADVDIAILRRDQLELQARLAGALVSKVVDGMLGAWINGEVLDQPVHELHATWPDGWHCEFLLNECDTATGDWIFRRDARIGRRLDLAFRDYNGVPSLAPEIVLLFKAKHGEPKDDADLRAALQDMSGEQRAWLRQALEVLHPNHSWIDILK